MTIGFGIIWTIFNILVLILVIIFIVAVDIIVVNKALTIIRKVKTDRRAGNTKEIKLQNEEVAEPDNNLEP